MNEYLNKETKKILNNTKTLGVHVRGSDFKRHYINHPNIVTIDEYLEETSKIMENNVMLKRINKKLEWLC